MKAIIKLILVFSIATLSCNTPQQQAFKPKEVYKSKDLIINQIAENSFQHISYLQTDDFGNVPCNGLIVRDNNEAIVFDTPTNDKSSAELINWITETMHCKINAVVPTHFHNDCLAGLKSFNKNNIPSYANYKTIEFAKQNKYEVPENSFNDSLILKVGKQTTITKFFGEGHTKDNVVAYFPSDKVMFGGCLIKELNATKGFLGDAVVANWSNTVQKVKAQYPAAKIIVPGHGNIGDQKLLDYTIKLYKN